MSIYKKLSDFKSKVGAVKKDASNPFHKSKYSTIESVLDTIEKPLEDVGLGFYQSVEERVLKTVIYDTDSGEKLESHIPLILAKEDMQQLGSAITYARRYGLVSMFGLEQEDDDGNKASGYDKPKTTQQVPKTQAKLSPQQVTELETLLHQTGLNREDYLNQIGIKNFGELKAELFAKCKNGLVARLKK